jgi:hypothetical protein
MPKFITIGYGSEAGYERTPRELRDAAHAADSALKDEGAILGVAGAPVQVRNPGAKGIYLQESAFMFSPLPVAGFAIIDAGDIDEAIAIAAKSPCAVADGVVEIWPLQTD